MGQTVNLLAYAFGGSNPSLPTIPTTIKPDVASKILEKASKKQRAHVNTMT
jgi:hypothetical protein